MPRSRSPGSEVVFITGASAGIGEALAREYASRGARLVLAARRVERLRALAAEFERAGTSALSIAADVNVDGELERAAEQARSKFGAIDVVFANAGFGVVGRVDELTLGDFRRQFETNVFGVLRTVYATLDDLKRAKGRLALVGSISGYLSTPGSAAYSMSKFAVRSLAETLAMELARSGVSVTHIAPGFTSSEIRRVDNRGTLREGRRDFVPKFLRQSAEDAAKEIADAVDAREPECILTRHGRAGAFLGKHVPQTVVRVLKHAPARKKKK